MVVAATTSRENVPDERLVEAVREGDRSAFADLYVRYSAIAHRFACRLLGTADGAEDLVSEAFAKVLDRLVVGGGPTIAFHSYLLTTIRTTMYKQWAADRLIDRQVEVSDVSAVENDPLIDRLDVYLVVRAFRTLSARWQAVLWHLEVEKRSTAEVAVLLGIQPNAVAALAFRAREALRIAYLQMHVNTRVDDGCRESACHLVAWLCGRLHRAMRSRVEQHVRDCAKCSIAAAELSDLVAELRRMVPIMSG
jgi:RNA polymerase sigma factor (sigma-70 family)